MKKQIIRIAELPIMLILTLSAPSLKALKDIWKFWWKPPVPVTITIEEEK